MRAAPDPERDRERERALARRDPHLPPTGPCAAFAQELPAAALEDACRVAIHSILFHRALGPMTPRVRELDDWGVRYCSVPDGALDAFVDSFVEQVPSQLRRVGPKLHRVRFQVALYRKVKRGSFLGISTGVDKRVWETWGVSLLSNAGETMPSMSLASSLGPSLGSRRGRAGAGAETSAIGSGAAAPVSPVPATSIGPASAGPAGVGIRAKSDHTIGRAESPLRLGGTVTAPMARRGTAGDGRPPPVRQGAEEAGRTGRGPPAEQAWADGGGGLEASDATERSSLAATPSVTSASHARVLSEARAAHEALSGIVAAVASQAAARTAHVPPIDFDAPAPFFYKFELEFQNPAPDGPAATDRSEGLGSRLREMGKLFSAGPSPLLPRM